MGKSVEGQSVEAPDKGDAIESTSMLSQTARRYPVASYFVLTFAISWAAALLVAAPRLIRGQPLSTLTGILMFPAMLFGPSLSGILLARIVDGPAGLRSLFARIFSPKIPARWFAALLLPPAIVLTVLFLLKTFVSSAYTPNRFYIGILFGIPAGVLEEIGWTGYAFPKMRSVSDSFFPAIALGLLWSLWHLPVINFLGAVVPHGAYWLPFFLAFGLAMTAMRVLIGWMYASTNSVLLAQMMHISSTGSLVIFSPPVTAGQEAGWYAIYGAALWVVVCVAVGVAGKRLAR